jgi:hypothetical protein
MSKDYQQNIIYKDEKRKILTEEKYILLRWQQFFQLLLEDELQPLEEKEKEHENYLSYFKKKETARECSNYRGITLLNVIYRIFACLIYDTLTKYSQQTLGEYQAGFRPSRSTVNQIHVVRQILEKCYEFGIELHNIFIGRPLTKSVDRRYMKALKY